MIGNETLKIEDAVDNSGTIMSSGAASVVQIDGDVTNESTGQIGAGNGGTLTFGAVTVTNDAGGDIGAQSVGQITFDHSHIENHGHIGPNGGTVIFDHSVVENDSAPSESGNGGITADGGGTITFEYGCVTNNGAIEAQDGSSITFEHDRVVNTAGTNLDGNGIGAFDGGSMTFTDSRVDNTGFIRAFTGSGDDGSAGTIDFTDSTVNNAGGTIAAIGTGSVIELADTTINGGTLATDLNGLIEVVASVDGDLVFDGSANAVTVQGIVQVEKCAALDLVGTIIDNGTIEIVSGDPDLVIDGTVTLNGSGTVNLDGTGSDIIGASTGTNTLDNSITIKGAGEIGAGDEHLTLNNQSGGVVDADITDATLTIDTGNTVTNTGTLEATNGGTLQIDDVVNNDGGTIKADGGTVDLDTSTTNVGTIEAINGGTVDFNGGILNNTATSTVEADGGTVNIDASIENYGGTIEAVGGGIVTIGTGVTVDQNFGGILEATGAGSEIEIKGGTTVKVGTLETSDGGLIEVLGGDNTFLNVAIEDSSLIQIDDGATLTLQDTTTLDGTVTLEGDGTVLLQPTNAQIAGGIGGGTLLNETTIEGGGAIGDGSGGLVLDNRSSGIIDANLSGHLVIDTGNKVTNAGTLEATAGGTLEIHDNVTNTGGTIAASDPNSIVELFGATIIGGTLEFERRRHHRDAERHQHAVRRDHQRRQHP